MTSLSNRSALPVIVDLTLDSDSDHTGASGPSPKRQKLSAPRNDGGHAARAQAGPAPSRPSCMGTDNSMANKTPSVQYMNAALKTGGTTTSLVAKVAGNGPRPLQIGRMSGSSSFDLPSPRLTTPGTTPTNASLSPTNASLSPHDGAKALPSPTSLQSRQIVQSAPIPNGQIRSRAVRTGAHEPHSKPSNSRPARSDDDGDSVMSDISFPAGHAKQSAPAKDSIHVQHPSLTTPTTPAVSTSEKSLKNFSEEEEHLLIFLKEVKELPWKGSQSVTYWFNKDYPGRKYHTLQSRYTKKTNRRDRTEDPKVLKLPSRWAAEAALDWKAVRPGIPEAKVRSEVSNLTRDAANFTAPIPSIPHHTTEQDYSSGTDSAPRQQRTRRAPPVNYDVRRRFRHFREDESDAEDVDDAHRYANQATPVRSESSFHVHAAIPRKAVVVTNEPLDMHFTADDAAIGLLTRSKSSGFPSQKLPYLNRVSRKSLQGPPEDWDWDQLPSREWQGSVLHVDFGSAELKVVQKAISQIVKNARVSGHSTQRRHLRSLLKDLSEPTLLRLSRLIQQEIPGRDSSSIAAFLDDARAGAVSDCPQILRLAAARPERSSSSIHTWSTTSMIRHREFGSLSRRGCKTANTPLSYQMKNKVMDTLGPSSTWTGASSDIHTLAWSPDGERFAAGAVAVTDDDSMQYNRPNNLLFCDISDTSIHELAEHSIRRERTASGANASHAMFVSQDPNLYTTVTDVGFAPSGRKLYSAAYDNSLIEWDVGQTPSQPTFVAKFKHSKRDGQVLMDVNPKYEDVLATGAKTNSGAKISLLKLNEENDRGFNKHNFFSEKGQSRPDLKILPQALRFEPRHGNLLLAGFGANARNDDGYDSTGDICLWDVTSQTQMTIHGSSKNVFDVAFNPNRRFMPLFAAGCVANGNVNRGTRSVIRLYEERSSKYLGCQVEIECKALDINHVVWSCEDEHLIAAGCTDSRVYVWDVRRPTEPLQTLSHGHSLMPLEEGVHHELRDTGIRFLSWGGNATRLYTGSSDGVVKVWDVTRSSEDGFIKDLVTLDSGIMAGSFSHDFSRLVVGEVNGSLTVLDVGREDCDRKDVERLRYVPYAGRADLDMPLAGDMTNSAVDESSLFNGNYPQLQVKSMGSLPVRQVVQGPGYQGPFDQSVDAPYLREQALEFQASMAKPSGHQCELEGCKNNHLTITSEEFGDSGRSIDRVPDQLRLDWTAIDDGTKIMPGKLQCTQCRRAARPSTSNGADALCERCSFTCFRCGSNNSIKPDTTKVTCDTCFGIWEIGTLGYECFQQPTETNVKIDVPSLRRYGRDRLVDRFEDKSTSFGDEMNALTDYYFSLAIDRPESPPL